MQVFNAKMQQLEDVGWSVDGNNEIVATFADGTFLKFPAGTSAEDLQQLVIEHGQASSGQEVISPEQLQALEDQRKASTDLVDQLNQGEDKTNASATTDSQPNN